MDNKRTEQVNSIFEQPWWLEAVAPGRWREAIVEKDGIIRITAEAARDVMLRIQTRTSPVFEREMTAGEKLDLIQTEENILIPDID